MVSPVNRFSMRRREEAEISAPCSTGLGNTISCIFQTAMSLIFKRPADQPADHTLAKVWISRPGGPGDPDPIPGEPTGPYPVGRI